MPDAANRRVRSRDRSTPGSRPYFEGVAVARFAMRKAVRIVDEEARQHASIPWNIKR